MDLKKWTTLFVLSLFLVSIVPAVFADEGTGSEGTSDTEDTTDDSDDAAEDAVDDAEDAADEAAKADREAARERLKTQREELRETRKNAMEAIKKARESFKEAREKVRGKDATNDDKQQFLLASADKIIELLQRLRDRVDASDVDNKEAKLAEIDDAIAAVQNAQSSVEALDPATATKDDIKAARDEVKDAWAQAREVLKKGTGQVVTKRIGLIVERMDHLKTKLDKILARLTEKGYDVSGAEALQAEFDDKLASAQTNWDAAKAAYDAGDVKAGHDSLVLAQKDLKNAHVLLKDIVKSIRSTTKTGALEEVESETEDDAETESSDDVNDDANDDDTTDAEDESADDADDDSAETPATETVPVGTETDTSTEAVV